MFMQIITDHGWTVSLMKTLQEEKKVEVKTSTDTAKAEGRRQ